MTRTNFDIALKELHNNLIKMGIMVEESIENAIIALKTQDIKLAKKVFEEDDLIDDQEQLIERMCLNLIARQQPIAKDLRDITAVLKIITDLERIGDHSADICELAIKMANLKYIKPLIDIPKMGIMAKKMVNNAITSYIKMDIDLAFEVCASDDYVDDLYDSIKLELVELIKSGSNNIDQIIDFLLITKYLERMADHATNISEWVTYIITGNHQNIASLNHKDALDYNPFDDSK